MPYDPNSKKAKELDRRAAMAIHKEHVIDEIILQHFLRFEVFENIKLKDLKRAAKVIGGSVRNEIHRIDNGDQDYKLMTDENMNDPYYWRDMAMAGIKANKAVIDGN